MSFYVHRLLYSDKSVFGEYKEHVFVRAMFFHNNLILHNTLSQIPFCDVWNPYGAPTFNFKTDRELIDSFKQDNTEESNKIAELLEKIVEEESTKDNKQDGSTDKAAS